MFIHGSSFIKTQEIIAKFSWEEKVTRVLPCIFKNETLLGIQIPDMGGEVPEGDHLISVEVSLDGQ